MIGRIREAAAAIYDPVVRTPLVPVATGDHTLFLKLETLQPVGSFKIRGAWNAARHLSEDRRAQGLWTVSAGNAALGVALAARRLGVPCEVLVMDTAPAAKVDVIEALGARIIRAPYEACWTAVERREAPRLHGHLIHPFDDDDVIAGNGTIGLEILDDLPDVQTVVVAVGGGGLLAGVAAALKARRPGIRVVAAEPATAAPLAASLAAGRPMAAPNWTASFVDGAGGRSVLPSMWDRLHGLVDEAVVVELEDVRRAMRFVAERVHVICEGAAACAVAAALRRPREGSPIVAVVSGGNVDLSRFCKLTASAAG